MKPTGPIPPHFCRERRRPAADRRLCRRRAGRGGGRHAAVRLRQQYRRRPDRRAYGRRCRTGLRYIILSPQILTSRCSNFIGRYVDGFRVVSRGELERLKRAELAGIPMTFAGPGKRDDELEAGIEAGATISVESEGEAAPRDPAPASASASSRSSRSGSIRRSRSRMAGSPWARGRARSASMRSASRSGRGPARSGCRLARPAHLRRRPVPRRRRADRGAPGDHRLRRRDRQTLGMPLPELNLGGGFDVPCFARRAAARHLPHGDGAARDHL